jgi:hypothetical protein
VFLTCPSWNKQASELRITQTGVWRPDIRISFDRPISGDCREGTTDSSVTPGVVLAALIAVLFLFGPRVFDRVKNAADMSTPQANIEVTATGETKTP